MVELVTNEFLNAGQRWQNWHFHRMKCWDYVLKVNALRQFTFHGAMWWGLFEAIRNKTKYWLTTNDHAKHYLLISFARLKTIFFSCSNVIWQLDLLPKLQFPFLAQFCLFVYSVLSLPYFPLFSCTSTHSHTLPQANVFPFMGFVFAHAWVCMCVVRHMRSNINILMCAIACVCVYVCLCSLAPHSKWVESNERRKTTNTQLGAFRILSRQSYFDRSISLERKTYV